MNEVAESAQEETPENQRAELLARLLSGPVTTLEAQMMGIGRPAARVLELREDSHPITTTMVKREKANGKTARVAEYRLETVEAEQ